MCASALLVHVLTTRFPPLFAQASTAFEFGDAYDDDPPRHPDCVPCTFKPFCGETRLDLMTGLSAPRWIP